jgi:glycyl-tRNA synthetase alpha chain
MTLQKMISTLNDYWSAQGCAILQPYDIEMGAGTKHPATALRVLGPEPWNIAYVQPSRRPADGRYTRNPQRSQRYYQYQVIMKPSPDNIVDLYMGSLDALGFDTKRNDVRLVEDDWEDQAAGAGGVGWEIWVNGAEITQFTFFQQMGGIECNPVCAEVTYGPERLCLMLNDEASFWGDLMWSESLSYRQVDFQLEMQNNVYNFEVASVDLLLKLFELYESESRRIIETPVFWDGELGILSSNPSAGSDLPPSGDGPLALVYPAFDFALKCSHVFNLLDARGAVGVTQRAEYINRIRARVRACCLKHVEQYAVPSRRDSGATSKSVVHLETS